MIGEQENGESVYLMKIPIYSHSEFDKNGGRAVFTFVYAGRN